MKTFRLNLAIFLAVALILALANPAFAATTATITVTNTPQFIGISVDPTAWTVNSTGNGHVVPSTTYYSNPEGNLVEPTTAGATDNECMFTITNNSNVAIDLTVTSSDMTGGSDDSTNSDDGTAGATTYGAKTYFSGQSDAAWVVAKVSGSSVGKASLAASTNIKMGLIIAEQTGDWTGPTASTFTVTITAAAS